MLHIVLVEPEIPQNTGNIARTCAATGSMLHLVKPLGFSLDDKYLKRAGLDYWHMMTYKVHESFAEIEAEYPDASFWFLSTKGKRNYAEVSYAKYAFLVFGRETRGLDEELLAARYDRCVRIPMIEGARSLNLANSVAIVTYEALRQQGFASLQTEGALHHTEVGEAWRDYI